MATFQTYVVASLLSDRSLVWAALRGSAGQPAAFPLIRGGQPTVLSCVAISVACRKAA